VLPTSIGLALDYSENILSDTPYSIYLLVSQHLLHQIYQIETRRNCQNYLPLMMVMITKHYQRINYPVQSQDHYPLRSLSVRSCRQNQSHNLQSCNLHQFQDQPLLIPLVHIYPRKIPHQLMTISLRKGHGFGTTSARLRFPISGMKRRSGG
jgi:hypothetical protein